MFNLYNIIGNILIDKNGNNYNTINKLNNKYIAMYFSAKWCGPCKQFTPKLVDFYNKIDKNNFELIFISLDKNLNEFNMYFNDMPWLSIPFDKNKSESLSEMFNIDGIPTLHLYDNYGNLISTYGKDIIAKYDNILINCINKKYNFDLLFKTTNLIKGQGDGRISENDANELINILNSKQLTIDDYRTILFIIHNYNFTDIAIHNLLSYLE
jgi:thiol-disulfide isomerase/thioredoxin